MWVLWISIWPLSTILIFDFGILPTLWYYLLFIWFPLIKQAVNSSDMCTISTTTEATTHPNSTTGNKVLVYNVCF